MMLAVPFALLVTVCFFLAVVCSVQMTMLILLFVDKHASVMLCGLGVYMMLDLVVYCYYSRRADSRFLCPICLTETVDVKGAFFSMSSTTLECGHRFHSRCIDRWMATQDTCPCCRRHCF